MDSTTAISIQNRSVSSKRTYVYAVALLGLFATGCPNPNIYATPRTTPVGKVAHTFAGEAVRVSYEITETVQQSAEPTGPNAEITVDENFNSPTGPSYHLRVGIAEDFDIGFKVNNLSSVGADAKWNFYKSNAFDMAVDPGIQHFPLGLLSVTYYHLPVILGLNFNEQVSLVGTPGISFATVSTPDDALSSGIEQALAIDGAMARFGLGVNFRVSENFAIQPEATLIRGIDTSDSSVTWVLLGIGFNVFNLPDFTGTGM